MKASKLKERSTQKVMLYGAPFSGKSTVAAKLAEKYNLIWVSLENKVNHLSELPLEWQERIEVINIKDSKALPFALPTVLNMVQKKVRICEEHGGTNCPICIREYKQNPDEDMFVSFDPTNIGRDTVVVFDSVTQLVSSAISVITAKKPDDYKLEFDDWGLLSRYMETFFGQLQACSYNVVVISHEVEAEDPSGKKRLVPIGGSRNTSAICHKYFDHVVRASISLTKKHELNSSTSDSSVYVVGSRGNVDLKSLPSPTLLPLFTPPSLPTIGDKPNPEPNPEPKPKPNPEPKLTSLELLKLRK